jgi:hypothetical protein
VRIAFGDAQGRKLAIIFAIHAGIVSAGKMVNVRKRFGIAAHTRQTYILGVLAPRAQDVC